MKHLKLLVSSVSLVLWNMYLLLKNLFGRYILVNVLVVIFGINLFFRSISFFNNIFIVLLLKFKSKSEAVRISANTWY